MIDATSYNITIRKSKFDEEVCFEARIAEFPDLTEYADSYEEAYSLAIDAIETTAEIFAEQGRAMPPPIVLSDDYSGRVTLRLAKSLHRALAQTAEKEGVSLNQHLTNILNYYAGYAHVASEEQINSSPWHVQPQHSEKRKVQPVLEVVRQIPLEQNRKYA